MRKTRVIRVNNVKYYLRFNECGEDSPFALFRADTLRQVGMYPYSFDIAALTHV